MIWVTVSSWSCFCWLYRASPSSAARNIINLISVLSIWWCPCVESSRVVGRGCVNSKRCTTWELQVKFYLGKIRTAAREAASQLWQVSRDLWLLRPGPVIPHGVTHQQKPSSELGTSLPSNTGQNGHEMPPKVWSDLWPQGGCVNYQLVLSKSIAKEKRKDISIWMQSSKE